MQCGLLGRKLSHSYSPKIHRSLGDYNYKLYEIEPEDLSNFLENEDFDGLNVTIPYKKAVIPFCDELSPIAQKLGAVNTLVKRDGKLIGHNTDYFGFESMVKKCGIDVSEKKALVLGRGGASATAVAVLTALGATVTVISRSGVDNYENLEKHADAAIIVNATPIGMYPETDKSPIDLKTFPTLQCALDLIYNPANTAFLQQAQMRNIPCCNGLLMLVAQAKQSAEWFTQSSIDNACINKIYQTLRFEMENIVLIGMPGCGKSTIGKILSDKLCRSYLDADQEIVADAGTSIPVIFEQEGELGFRKRETQALSKICKTSGAVIATGGGCITKPENYAILHQNGQIIWIQRDISQLPTDGRPLSKTTVLDDMYAKRKPLYESFADFTVQNNTTPDEVADAIIHQLLKERAQ